MTPIFFFLLGMGASGGGEQQPTLYIPEHRDESESVFERVSVADTYTLRPSESDTYRTHPSLPR